MDVGAIEAGIEVVFANDLDKHACATYKENIGDHIVCGSIYDEISKMRSLPPVDLVMGGPPCQGFSVAGKMSPHDERSKLVFAFMDVVRIARPTVFVMENVRGLGQLSKFSEVRKELFNVATRM